MSQDTNTEAAIRATLDSIDSAWRRKVFDGLADCFDEGATIVGPDYQLYASGQSACAESYREFANNAAVLNYSESNHQLRYWGQTAVYTFSWQMTYQREEGPKKESGTDQLVLSNHDNRWRVVFRYIFFARSA